MRDKKLKINVTQSNLEVLEAFETLDPSPATTNPQQPPSNATATMDCDDGIKNENNDINQLLNSFSNLQTNEHDDLVVGFQNIANELSYSTARFFLEMNNW